MRKVENGRYESEDLGDSVGRVLTIGTNGLWLKIYHDGQSFDEEPRSLAWAMKNSPVYRHDIIADFGRALKDAVKSGAELTG